MIYKDQNRTDHHVLLTVFAASVQGIDKGPSVHGHSPQ
jgi:hypothetical protein